MNKRIKKSFVSAIILSLVLTLIPCDYTGLYANAADISGNEIIKKAEFVISDEADWMTFYENCRLDEWSRGRIVRLDADIDLTDEACEGFKGISSFSGTFMGNGHTISGVNLSEATESIGLFKYLEEDGVITNLTVSGEITTTDSDYILGGIVGVNAGSIRRCSFSGYVSGKGTTGGIAGYNGSTGTITYCTVSGTIQSAHTVGGICGENRGVISECANNAGVNSDSTWFEGEDTSSSSSLTLDSLLNTGVQTIKSGSDIGGIAGCSDGIIAGCTNNCIVGYLHTGKNVGGIVGRQSGNVIDCTNKGFVYGKQDVGGIVGQLEPRLTQEEAEALSTAVNDLHDYIEILTNDMGDMGDTLNGDIEELTEHADAAQKTTTAITDELTDVIEKDVEVVNDLAGRLDYVMDHIPGVLDNVDDALDAMEAIGDDLANIADDLDIITKAENDEYDYAKNNRLTLYYGQGGSLTSNVSSPEEGADVTLTITVNTDYVLKSLTKTVYGGDTEDVTAAVSNGTYSFTMPADNLTFRATFDYVGAYAYPYTPPVSPAGADVSAGSVSGNDVSGNVTITTESSEGGTLVCSAQSAKPGDEVTFAAAGDSDYCLKSLVVNGVDVTDSVSNGTYTYTIPSDMTGTLTAVAEFAKVILVITGEAGGTANYAVSDSKVYITVTAQTGAALDEPLTLTDSDGNSILYEKMYAETNIFSFDVTDSMMNGYPAYLYMTFTAESSQTTVDEAMDRISDNIKAFNECMQNISDINDRINEILDDGNGGTKDIDSLSRDEKEELEDLLKQLTTQTVKAGSIAGDILTDVGIVYEILSPYVEDAMKALSEDMKSLSEHYSDLTAGLKGTSSAIRSIVEYLNALDDIRFVNLSSNFDKNTEKLSTELSTIIKIMKRLNEDAGEYTDILLEDMDRVNDQLNLVFDLLIQRVDNLSNLASGEDLLEDHSADEDLEYACSEVSTSTNNGHVNGDTNVGGIVGAISRDGSEEGGDADGDETTESSFGARYIACAIVNECENNGFITIRTENGGGIAGSASLGYIKDSRSAGSVYSESASVVGGIAGYSAGTIGGCYSLTELSGTEYIGGIAGKAGAIRDSSSMASILSCDGVKGAISGAYLSDDDESDDLTAQRAGLRENYTNNRYVSSVLYGIDEVSYAGAAEPVTYKELTKDPDASAFFSKLEVVFLDEDENVVGRQSVKYGDGVDVIEYPDIVAEDGDYFEWTGLLYDHIEGNIVLRASSTANVVVLESENKTGGKTTGYAEGEFTERAQLEIEEVSLETTELPSAVKADDTSVCYSISITNGNLSAEDETKVRLLSPEGDNISAYVIKDGKWESLAVKDAGKYTEVTITGDSAIVCLAAKAKETNLPLIIGCSAAGVLAVLAAAGTAHKKKKKKKAVKAPEDKPEDEEEIL